MEQSSSYMIKLINPTVMYKKDEIIEVLPTQIQVGRLPECYLRYSDEFRTVSRLHAIITISGNGVLLTKPHGLNNLILVNGENLNASEIQLKDNSKVQFSVDGPQIIIPYRKATGQKAVNKSKGDLKTIKILMYASYLFLLISIIILVVTIVKYL